MFYLRNKEKVIFCIFRFNYIRDVWFGKGSGVSFGGREYRGVSAGGEDEEYGFSFGFFDFEVFVGYLGGG